MGLCYNGRTTARQVLDMLINEGLIYRNPGADMRLRADELDQTLLGSTRAFHGYTFHGVMDRADEAHALSALPVGLPPARRWYSLWPQAKS